MLTPLIALHHNTHKPAPPHTKPCRCVPQHPTLTHTPTPTQIADKLPGVGGGLAEDLLTAKPLRTLLSKVRMDSVEIEL